MDENKKALIKDNLSSIDERMPQCLFIQNQKCALTTIKFNKGL